MMYFRCHHLARRHLFQSERFKFFCFHFAWTIKVDAASKSQEKRRACLVAAWGPGASGWPATDPDIALMAHPTRHRSGPVSDPTCKPYSPNPPACSVTPQRAFIDPSRPELLTFRPSIPPENSQSQSFAVPTPDIICTPTCRAMAQVHRSSPLANFPVRIWGAAQTTKRSIFLSIKFLSDRGTKVLVLHTGA
jgi:hypothetical protein